uniref:Uncharacterized protein n=1 Tax=Panagrolaimus sp. JU765 TaxID=591449 RepID=A0AC34RKH7_9BILA
MIEMCFVIFVLWLWATIIVGFSIGLIHLPKIFAGISVVFQIINFIVNNVGIVGYLIYEMKKYHRNLSDSKKLCHEIIKILFGVLFLWLITGVGIYYGLDITLMKNDASCKVENSTTGRTGSAMNDECDGIVIALAFAMIFFTCASAIWYGIILGKKNSQTQIIDPQQEPSEQSVYVLRPSSYPNPPPLPPPPPYQKNQQRTSTSRPVLPSYDDVTHQQPSSNHVVKEDDQPQ